MVLAYILYMLYFYVNIRNFRFGGMIICNRFNPVNYKHLQDLSKFTVTLIIPEKTCLQCCLPVFYKKGDACENFLNRYQGFIQHILASQVSKSYMLISPLADLVWLLSPVVNKSYSTLLLTSNEILFSENNALFVNQANV